MEEQSSPEDGHFVWSYAVEIANDGSETVQLKSRMWRITDALGRTEEVRGPGVVGQTPVIAARQIVPLHVRLPAEDPARHHGRQLSDDGRGRQALRRRHSCVLARQPLYATQHELNRGGQAMSVARGPIYTPIELLGASCRVRHDELQEQSRLIAFVEDYLLQHGVLLAPRCARATGRSPRFTPRSARNAKAASRSRAIPTSCPSTAKPGPAIRLRSEPPAAGSTARGAADMKGFLGGGAGGRAGLQARRLDNADPPGVLLR